MLAGVFSRKPGKASPWERTCWVASGFLVNVPTQDAFLKYGTSTGAYDKVHLINATDYINQYSRMHENME